MRKFYSVAIVVVSLVFMFSGAHASVTKLNRHNIDTFNLDKAVKTDAGILVQHKSPQRVDEFNPDELDAQWEDFDEMCTMVDGILSGVFGTDPISFPVNVQYDAKHPGWYRIVNPWLMYPLKMVVQHEGGTLTISDDVCIYLNATDPDRVILPICDGGFADEDGPMEVCSLLPVHMDLNNISEAMAIDMAGKLENQVITFSSPASLLVLQLAADKIHTAAYHTNHEGKFALVLPGGEEPVNYDIDIEKEEAQCSDEDGNYHFYVDADYRVPEIRYAVSLNYPNSQICQTIAETGLECFGGDDVVLNIADLNRRLAYATFVTVDDEGEWQEVAFAPIYPWDGPNDEWEEWCKAELTEDFMASYYDKRDGMKPETFQVMVERNVKTPGRMRIPNPYENWSHYNGENQHQTHTHYLYINAERPDKVFIEESPLGEIYEEGVEYAISSARIASMVEQMGAEQVFGWYGQDPEGYMVDDVITFGPEANIGLKVGDKNSWTFVNCYTHPDWVFEEYVKDPNNYPIPRFVAGSFKLDLSKGGGSGVGTSSLVNNSESAIEYFNLQGVRILNPESGLYIRRSGNGEVEKVMIQ